MIEAPIGDAVPAPIGRNGDRLPTIPNGDVATGR